ncbi:hypothetical protein, partial [Pusillimonas sp.]|uniref:hypothetical protein n=1 Tax=Pusillimonas sp. TaxID=3040095 RepID=UPI0037C87F8B
IFICRNRVEASIPLPSALRASELRQAVVDFPRLGTRNSARAERTKNYMPPLALKLDADDDGNF